MIDHADEGHSVAAKLDDHPAHDLEEVMLVVGANQGLIAFAQCPQDLSKPQIFALGPPTLGGVQETGDKEGFLSGANNIKFALKMTKSGLPRGKIQIRTCREEKLRRL